MSGPRNTKSLPPCSEISQPNQDEDPTIRNYIKTFCSGDLCVLGNVWINALRTALVGADFKLFPVVNAAPLELAPKKPPAVPFKDLPIYESPHYEYKDYLADKEKCPNHKVKLLHEFLYPYVRKWRKEYTESFCGLKNELVLMKNEACDELCKQRREFIKKMRCPDNINMRRGIVAFSTLSGYLLTCKRGIPSRIFGTTLGGLAGGALCFPDETDEFFRNLSYKLCKIFIAVYNKTCGKKASLRERVPCNDEMNPSLMDMQKSIASCPKKN